MFCIVVLCSAVFRNVSLVLNGDLLYISESVLKIMKIHGNAESARSFGT